MTRAGEFANNMNKKVMLCPDSLKLSSLGFDIGADSLSVLLVQKLRELTNGIDYSRCNFIKAEESSASARQNSIHFCVGSETGRFHDKNATSKLHMDSDHAQIFSSFSLIELEASRRIQGRETDECSSTKLESRQSYNFRLPSPISILDPSTLTESCNSSDSTGSNTTEGLQICCLIHEPTRIHYYTVAVGDELNQRFRFRLYMIFLCPCVNQITGLLHTKWSLIQWVLIQQGMFAAKASLGVLHEGWKMDEVRDQWITFVQMFIF